MQWLKQSTAASTIVGPILDSAGGIYGSAVIGDLNITKNGTTAAMASAATLTHIANGLYTLLFTTGNTDTLGRVDITCNKSTYIMPPKGFTVLAATTFDALVTNAAGASGGMLYNGANTGAVLPRVTLVDTTTTNTDMAAVKAKTDLIGRTTFISASSLVTSDGEMTIKVGDKHEFTFTSDTLDIVADLTAVTLRLGAKTSAGDVMFETTSATVLVATGYQSVKFTLLPAETLLIPVGFGYFDVQAEFASNNIRTFITGTVSVVTDYSGVA